MVLTVGLTRTCKLERLTKFSIYQIPKLMYHDFFFNCWKLEGVNIAKTFHSTSVFIQGTSIMTFYILRIFKENCSKRFMWTQM